MVERVAALQPQARINGVTVQKMAPARRGREIYIGVVTDHPFGPVIVFGAGGTMIELIRDRSMELPPLNQFLARRLIERSRVAETLLAWRGANAADLDALEHVLLRVSEMVCELPQLREMDINPIIVDEQARSRSTRASSSTARRRPTAGSGTTSTWRSCPTRRATSRSGRCAAAASTRCARSTPTTRRCCRTWCSALSPESRYFRFVSQISELTPTMLARFTLIDYDREMALVAVLKERSAEADGDIVETERIVGVSRYITNPDRASCEFALVVDDDYERPGPGIAADGKHHGRGARPGPERDRRPGARRQRRHAQADAQPGLHHRALCRGSRASGS